MRVREHVACAIRIMAFYMHVAIKLWNWDVIAQYTHIKCDLNTGYEHTTCSN